MTLVVPATVRCWWDARIHRSAVWERLAREAEQEQLNADLEVDHYSARELYRIACDLSSYAETLERCADAHVMGTAT